MSGFSRRRLLGWTGAGAALAGVGAVTGLAAAGAAGGAPVPDGVIPFRGTHQAGIVTPAQDRLHFVALDVTTTDPNRLRALLQKWTNAAERMTAGAEAAPGGAVNLNPEAPPTDTGEALGLPASSLTLTFGIGGSLLDKLGIARPAGLTAEFDTADLSPGSPVDMKAHIRLASAQSLGGVKILRRGYNFVDGSDGQGHLNAGLFFLAFMRDPQAQFVPMQRALANSDDLMDYIEHTSSALFACPAGLADGDYWGQALLES